MYPIEVLTRLGGVASSKQLLQFCSRRSIQAALISGDIHQDFVGKYSLPTTQAAIREAHRLAGVISHGSAANYWGWPRKNSEEQPQVTIPSNKKLRLASTKAKLHWAKLHPAEIDGIATSKARTLLDCITSYPFDEALSIADSALRNRDIRPLEFEQLVSIGNKRGIVQARLVQANASPAAANPFESVLRALTIEVRGFNFKPQLQITDGSNFFRPDLVDKELGCVLEADSHQFHSSRQAIRNDCRRYNALTLMGWTVLRFSWEDVMFNQDFVRETLTELKMCTKRRERSLKFAQFGVKT